MLVLEYVDSNFHSGYFLLRLAINSINSDSVLLIKERNIRRRYMKFFKFSHKAVDICDEHFVPIAQSLMWR